jgi:hypothetical protein
MAVCRSKLCQGLGLEAVPTRHDAPPRFRAAKLPTVLGLEGLQRFDVLGDRRLFGGDLMGKPRVAPEHRIDHPAMLGQVLQEPSHRLQIP